MGRRKRFRGLSPEEEAAFSQIAVGQRPRMAQKTLRSLESQGLIVSGMVGRTNANDRVELRREEYYVPIRVHMEWAAWCSENYVPDAS